LRKTHNTNSPVFYQNDQLLHHRSLIQPSRKKSNVSKSCCQNLNPIQWLTSRKSKNEDRRFSCLFFLSFSRALCSVLLLSFFFFQKPFCHSGCIFNSKRQFCCLLPINVVDLLLYSAGSYITSSHSVDKLCLENSLRKYAS